MPAANIYHPLGRVLRAELPLLAAGDAVRRPLGAAREAAPLVVHVHHAALRVGRTKLPLFAAGHAVLRLLGATGVGASLRVGSISIGGTASGVRGGIEGVAGLHEGEGRLRL